ncbi:MAG: glycosyltransferase family 2 protein [Bacteroidota bacterium]|nr:glycosyltransferase family 2 protein [Bacteroidota bacterium]
MIIDTRTYEVSVILTLYNSKKTFNRALDSVLHQTFINYELIIVDDGSNDDTESVIFPILKKNKNFKYIRHSNRKHPLSLNTGIINSTGKFIALIDSDDEYKSNHLEDRINFFLNNPEIDLIYSPATIVGDEKDFFVPDAKDNSKMIHLDECIIGGTFFGKRKVFEEMNGFKDVYSHDSEFYERANKKYLVQKFNSSTYIYYRNNPDSVINKLKKETDDQ